MTALAAVIDPEVAASSTTATPLEPPAPGGWSDWVGMAASIGCAIHCAAMPFVIAYLPSLGLSFLADEAFHKWMAVGCFAVALAAFVPGLRKHGRWMPTIVGSVGLVMISTAAFGFAGECCPSCESDAPPVVSTEATACTATDCQACASESSAASATGPEVYSAGFTASTDATSSWLGRVVPLLTPIGGLVLVSAHLLNRRYGCLCGCCAAESSDGGAK